MKKIIFKRLIFLIVFFDIAIGITYLLINNNIPVKTTETADISQQADTSTTENVKTVSLDETYDLNDLKLTEYTTVIEGRNFESTYNVDTEEFTVTGNTDVNIPYFQIDGLLDENIEISINYLLKNDIETKANEILESDDFLSDLTITNIKYSNFANTLSIYYSIYYIDKENRNIFEYIPENFDLNTGERIKLDDVIINTSETRFLISQKLYNSVVGTISDITPDEDFYYFKVENYNDVEEEIAKVIYNFQNENNINFVFDEKGIYFLDYGYDLLYKNCIDYITIYDKFSENYIFDGTYSKLKELPVLVARTDGEYQLIEEGENYLLDITLVSDYDSNAIAGETSFITDLVDSKVQDMKTIASQNSNTFYVFNCFYEASSLDLEEGYIYESYNEIKTTKDIYENALKSEILEVKRDYPEELYEPYMYGNIFVDYLDSSKYDITSNWTTYEFNPSTSELILNNFNTNNSDSESSEENPIIWDTTD